MPTIAPLDLDAHIVTVAYLGDVPFFADATGRIHRLDEGHKVTEAHDGLLAAVVDDASGTLLTGGEDGKVLRIAAMAARANLPITRANGSRRSRRVRKGPSAMRSAQRLRAHGRRDDQGIYRAADRRGPGLCAQGPSGRAGPVQWCLAALGGDGGPAGRSRLEGRAYRRHLLARWPLPGNADAGKCAAWLEDGRESPARRRGICA